MSTSAAAIGIPVNDTASLAGATTTAGGTVTYTVYTDDTCTTPATSQISAHPPAVTVTNAAVPDSAFVTFLQAGTYFWQAVYSGDTSNSAAVSVCASEPITITPNSPTITTTVVTGSPQTALATITDSATLAGATADAGGTVTYSLYSGSGATVCVAPNQVDSDTAGVTSGSVADGLFTSVAAGNYELQAVYSGDGNNDGSTSTCGTEPFTVTMASPTITTTLSASSAPTDTAVTDTATLAGATTNAGGTVTYTVYTDSACTTPASASQISGQAPAVTVTNAVVPPSAPVTFLAAGDYFWQAVYSGDANNTTTASDCASEPITITPDNPTITTTLVTLSPRRRWPPSPTRPPWPGPPPPREARSPTACIRAAGPRHARPPNRSTPSPPP